MRGGGVVALRVALGVALGVAEHISHLSSLHHPQPPPSIRQYCAFQNENDCYIVMDLMLGGDIRYYLKRKPKGFDEGTYSRLTAQ